MKIEEVYNKAKEGGYDGRLYSPHCEFLDKNFWICLGSALNWKDKKSDPLMYEWLYQWHQFINHLATGKSIEDYFKSL